MPHRPNPIPRYNGSNLPPQSQLHPSTTDVATGSRREKDGLPPRHRATSGATDPSSTAHTPTTVSSSSGPNAGSTPGGRPSGRALPPPRFQRKQRPPRVQQAIAAAANASSSSNATTKQTPNPPQSGGGRRGAANKGGGSSGQRGGAGTGTLTLGPANNWGAGTSAVVSLSMATINAASARASVIHPPQPPPPPPTVPTFDDASHMDYSLIPDFLSGLGRLELEGLDPVQLHNQITSGMGRTSTTLRNDLYASEYIHNHNNYSVPAPYLGGLERDAYLLSSNAGAGMGRETRNHAATVRARSHSHNHAAHAPVSSLYHVTNVTQGNQALAGTTGYSPVHPSFPHGSNLRLETAPVIHAIAPPGVDFDHQLRVRSQSLIAPVDSYRSREPLAFPPSLSTHPAPPASQQYPTFQSAVSNSSLNSTRYNSTSSMQAQHHLSLKTDLDNDIRSSGSAPQSASGSGPNSTNRKPLKSALKGQKSAPELADGDRVSPPATLGLPRSDSGRSGPGCHAPGQCAVRVQEPRMLPDLQFTLPDEYLQAQYAHQLRLLQEEYATKAAEAEMSRRRSLQRGEVAVNMRDLGAESEHGTQEMVVPAQGQVNLDTTPPSSGGGSAGGHRVAFFDEVRVIGQGEENADALTSAEQSEQDAAGYASWDDEWVDEADDEVTEFVYAPSTGADPAPDGIVEERGIDSEHSPGAEISDFDDDGGSDIGDRGHDDITRSTQRQKDTGESPPDRQSYLDTSPVESVVSSVQAVVHGHEPSPVTSEPIDQCKEHEQANFISTSASTDAPLLLPLVEVIAPTPIMVSKELGPSEVPRVELPKFDEMDKEDGILESAIPMSSAGSLESSDSNSTLKTGLANSTASSDTTVPPPAPVSPVTEENPSTARASSSLDGSRHSPRLDEAPASNSPQRHALSHEQQGSAALPHLPPTLQRLAGRISRGTLPTSQPNHPSNSAPLIPGPAVAGPSLEQYHSFQGAALSDYPLEDDQSLRRLSSATSLSSASSGLHGTVFPRPPFAPNPTSTFERDLSYGQGDLASYQNQHHVHNRMSARPSVPPPFPSHAVRRHLPDGAIPYSLSRRISRQSGLADYSSAASVESGSSHGGGTSGASHAHRARGRSVAGSMLSTSSGSHHRNLRAPPSAPSEQANVLSPSHSSSGMESLLSRASSEHWDKGLLSNAHSFESLGAVSAASGKSGGSGGNGTGRALGGESIWTLGKEEEARWPLAPPSSSGHGHPNQPRVQTQYTLRSLVPQMEPVMSSEPTSSNLPFKDRVQPLYSGSQHSYQLDLPNDAFDSFYPSYNPYSLPPAPEFDRPSLLMQHSRSVPALPVYEEDLVQGAYNDSRWRGNPGQSTLHTDWRNDLRHLDEPMGRNQDEALSQLPRLAQLRAQAPPFSPASTRHSAEHRLLPQLSSRSLPIVNPSDLRNTLENQRNFEKGGRDDSGRIPPSVSSSRPSVARSALYAGLGPGDAEQYPAQKSVMSLPATGGVFPRYQEVAVPYAETAVLRPASSGGRLKGLFKSRDSRIYK